MLKKVRKNANSYNTIFNAEMYNNTLGSLIVTHYILHLLETGEKLDALDTLDTLDTLDANEINKRWKSLRKKGRIGDKVLDFWIDDPDFIAKALDLFDMKPSYGNFCMVQSAFNTLFLPYINNEPMPIREDGFLPMSASQGKIYPIVEKIETAEKAEEDNTYNT